ncbi:kinesin-like protein KIN-7F [Punica granatum]|nr:kinesin-like protein KIN-7F [Punica granatum]
MGGSQDFDTVSVSSFGGQKEKILVSVRLRPLNDKERSRNDVSDWECINNSTIIFRSSIPERAMFPSAYTFDRVFGCESSTEQVYEEGAKEVALAVVSGINSSIFAYGQTSSGKTFTMSGITEYAVSDIYDYIEKHPEREFVLKFSAMEIYNEAVRDLLSSDSTPLRLLDDPERGTVVERLTEESLRDWDHFLELLAVCEAQRHIGETSLNEMSSRSHQILRLTIESSAREYLGPDNSSTLTACVNFVDLAGSERASQTLSAGTRLKEGCHINRSLLTLGTVIRKLSKGRSGHIPYRDSKLTRILQNSLGGNARTAMICTMSPARNHVEQSRNTLLFASCAKEVTTNAQVNAVMSDKALVKQLQRELARMESELRSFSSSSLVHSDSSALLKEKELQIEKMDKEIKELTQQRDIAQSRIQDLLRSTSDRQGSKLGNVEEPNHGKHYERLNSSNSNLDFADNVEDNFLLDGTSPRLSMGMSPKFVGPDQLSEWEVDAPKIPEPNSINGYNDDREVTCKEVCCIEEDESRPNIIDQKEETERKVEENENKHTKEEPLTSLKKTEGEVGDSNPNVTYDSLQKKIQDMQKTINCLVSLYPAERSSPSSSSDMDTASTVSSKVTRSRSCKSLLIGAPPYSTSEGSEAGFSGNLERFPGNISCDFDNTGRKESLTSARTSPDLTELSRLENKKFVAEENKKEEDNVQLKQVDDTGSMQKADEKSSKQQAACPETLGAFSKPEPSDWGMEFKVRRGKIVELWQACNVPLLHRTYFYLLFKGDPSDAVYLEVELRRLSFLKGSSHEQASSKKALNKEREMLGKRILKKFRKRERESLYKTWNIGLNTKQRSQQLARRLWTDTRDMAHIEDSARLVARLVDWSETGRIPKEMFGLSFSPQPLGRRSFGWRSSMSSLSSASSLV